MYYIKKADEIILVDEDINKIKNTLLFMPQMKDEDGNPPPIQQTEKEIISIDNKYYFKEDVLDELQQKEKEKVSKLKMTPRDFLLSLVEIGIDFNEIEQLINSNQQIKIELNYCNHVYRGNPLLDQLAPKFNITKEQLDTLFKEKGE